MRPCPLLVLVAMALAGCPHPGPAGGDLGGADMAAPGWPASWITLQFLALSDWQGQLDPLPVMGQDAGGADVLSAYLRRERQQVPATLTLGSGNLVGATPPLSSLFDDQPTVAALDAMGLSASALGTHEFDHGLATLQGLISQAHYRYTSANLQPLDGNLQGVAAPYLMLPLGGLKVAVAGVTGSDTPALVPPGGLGPLQLSDPAQAASAAAAQARAAGADVVVVLAHIGAWGVDEGMPIGPLFDLARAVQGADLIIGGHTDQQAYVVVNGSPVVQSRSSGRSYARVRLGYDPAHRRVAAHQVDFVTPWRCQAGSTGPGCTPAIPPDPAVTALLQPYRERLPGKLDATVDVAQDAFPRDGHAEQLGETALGDLVADALRARYGTQIAVISADALAAPLPSSYQPGDHTLRRPGPGYAMGPPYDLVVGDAAAVLPGGDFAITRTISGKLLWYVLEQGLRNLPAASPGFLQVSGIRFTYDAGKQPYARLVSVSLADGTPVPQDDHGYTLATSAFLNNGGDGYVMLLSNPADKQIDGGTGTLRDRLDQVLRDALARQPTVAPRTDGRITTAH